MRRKRQGLGHEWRIFSFDGRDNGVLEAAARRVESSWPWIIARPTGSVDSVAQLATSCALPSCPKHANSCMCFCILHHLLSTTLLRPRHPPANRAARMDFSPERWKYRTANGYPEIRRRTTQLRYGLEQADRHEKTK